MRRQTGSIALLGAVVALGASCGGPQTPPPDPAPDHKATSPALPPAAGGWDCTGKLVPPTGWLQDTAFDDAGSVEAASDKARQILLERTCAGAPDCSALQSKITIWETGQGGGRACAMAVIEDADVQRFRASLNVGGLEEALREVARELVGKRGKARVAIDKIIDGGAAGGARARWLEQRMARAFGEVGAQVVEVPRDWNGQGLPPGVDMVAGATIEERVEGERKVAEAVLSARVKGGGGIERLLGSPVTFPTAAAPDGGEPAVTLPPSSPELSVRLESSRAGGLCLGERTQLWLYASEEAHVRVYDLYGAEGALLIFPNEDMSDDRVPAGKPIPLGGKLGFEAMPVPGSEVERFLVVAAPTREGLGKLGKARGYCRVEPTLARQLHRAEGLPQGTRAASDSFRLVQGEDCPAPPAAQTRQGVAVALDSLPICAQ